MTVSKLDIDKQTFARAWRGYAPGEVDAFLSEVAESLGQLAAEKARLAERMHAMERALAEHRQRETVLRDTLLTTQKLSEEIKAGARKEAELIIQEAHAKAEAVLNQAHQRLAQLHDDISELKRQRTQFEVKLRGLIEVHQKLLEQGHEEYEQLDALESKLRFFKKAT